MEYALIIDVIVAILLIVTIIYAINLNKRLSAMRRDRAKLEKIATEFAQSTARANESITHLKNTNETLQRQLDTAQSLRDDLAYLLDRGEKSADRLEDLVRVARDIAGVGPVATTQTAAPDLTRDRSVSIGAPGTPAPQSTPVSPARGRGGDATTSDQERTTEQSEAEQALLRALRSAG